MKKPIETFQLNIFKEINKNNERNNFTISPLSIYHILSLTTNGAANKTLEEMLNVLGHKDLNEMNENNKLLASFIEEIKSVELANAVFTRVRPIESFSQMIKQYKANIDELKSTEQINKWCSDETHGKIQKVINNLSPNDIMILINAIYFKGIWKISFEKKNTLENCFRNYGEETIEVDFMCKTDKYDYVETNEVQALSLNYKNDKMSATIILPKTENINDYIENLTLKSYNDIIKKMKNKKVKLYLPKFEINYEEELSNTFKSLGMVQPFSDIADFSSMLKENNAKIGKIIHKTYIKVNEEGTEAAAITTVIMKKKSMGINMGPKIPVMYVGHPFLFIIRNENLPSGYDIVFISKIEKLDNTEMI